MKNPERAAKKSPDKFILKKRKKEKKGIRNKIKLIIEELQYNVTESPP